MVDRIVVIYQSDLKKWQKEHKIPEKAMNELIQLSSRVTVTRDKLKDRLKVIAKE